MIKDTNTSHYKYTGYGICFDRKLFFSFGNRSDARNVIILGTDMTFSGSDYTGRNNFYVLGKTFMQRFSTDGAGHTISQKGICKTNMSKPEKRFVLSLHYNGDNYYLFVNGVQQLKFKSSISHTDNLSCLGNFSSDWSIKNSTKTGLYGSVHDFAVDYVAINGVKTIYDIHRYLITKHNI